ncbi:hypothetical protein ACIQAC_12325 [Streptomyces sp. NPDC088387]|uniref:hypothetical protein n=1 Tax=Streptomyces sp. NPDC088387 TaxID=3365859 RepID=UPI0037F49892
MKRSSRARLSATAAVGALSLALITGCSSDGGSTDSEGSADSGSGAADAKALSKTDLEKLLLVVSDVKGYRVDSGDDTLPKSKTEVKTDKAACDPLAWATAGLAPGETDANVSNTVAEDPTAGAATPTDPSDLSDEDIENALGAAMTFVGLSSYEGDGAEKAMKAVSDGVGACAGGYALTTAAESSKVTKVASVEGSGQGDESVAFSEGVDMDGEGTATFLTEVVRKGNTVATFYTVDFSSLGSGKAAEIPAAVVEAQVAKIK